MNRRIALAGFLLFSGLVPPVSAQLEVFRTLGSDRVKVTASSTYSQSTSAERLIDHSGMNGLFHDNNMWAGTMWHSDRLPSPGKAYPGTREGKVWISFAFDRPYQLREIWIWNHNQAGFTRRGLKKIYVEYSMDGKTWKTLPGGPDHSWTIPEARGGKQMERSLILNAAGIPAKYLVITANGAEGNYGDEYYGLSEVQFVTDEKIPLSGCLEIRGENVVFREPAFRRPYEIFLRDGIAYGTDRLMITAGGTATLLDIDARKEAFRQEKLVIPFHPDYSESATFELESKKGKFRKQFQVPPPVPLTVYLIPQSHVDIGYTDYPDKVKKILFRNIDYAIDLARKTQQYPEGSRFRWNTEVLWPVEEYLLNCSPSEKDRLLDAVSKGWINLDGSFASVNTSLGNGEEMLRLFTNAHELNRNYRLNINTVQQVDVPGMSWGIVTSMKQSGMRYMLNLPNIMDDRSLENHPFYWISASGEDTILHFQTYYYNLGYELKGKIIPNYLSGNEEPVYADHPDSLFLDPFIFSYHKELLSDGYPYDMIPFAWTMTDNAPLDPDLPDVVRRWNEKYAYPRVIISSTRDFFTAFEKKYKPVIPVMRGDYTEYWTDGAASGARETALNRNNAEQALRAETLYALLNPGDYRPDVFRAIWRNILLFTEHTWGSYKSATDPHDPDVEAQWKIKAGYATDAGDAIEAEISRVNRRETAVSARDKEISLINTNSWIRSGVVYLPGDISSIGDRVVGQGGRTYPSQRMLTGELAVLLDEINGYRTQTLRLLPGTAQYQTGLTATEGKLENPYYLIQYGNGSKLTVIHKKSDVTFVLPLDRFCRYVSGTGEKADTTWARVTSLRLLEKGPVAGSIVVEYQVPGCRNFSLDIRLVANSDNIELTGTLDKLPVLEKESMSFEFGFTGDDPEIRYEIPWGIVNPGKDLLKGSNRAYQTVQHFIDISCRGRGITLFTPDAPLFRYKKYKTGDKMQCTLESMILNNHWHTNFPAYQQGKIRLRYQIRLHGEWDLPGTIKRGIEQFHPFFATDSPAVSGKFPVLGISGQSAIVTSCKPADEDGGYLIRLYNASDEKEQVSLTLMPGSRIWESSFREDRLAPGPESFEMKPFEVKSLIIE